MNIADGEVGMQRLFVDERFIGLVASLKLHFQLRADGHSKAQLECVIAEAASNLSSRKRERDLHFSVVPQLCCFDRPLHTAREAMRGAGLVIAARAKPGKNDGHAAANRFAGFEQTFGADKKYRSLPALASNASLERPADIVRFGRRRRDCRAHQSARSILEPERIWNIELIGQFWWCMVHPF